MYAKNQYYRLGQWSMRKPAIRFISYVIFNEVSHSLGEKYLSLLKKKQHGCSADLKKTIEAALAKESAWRSNPGAAGRPFGSVSASLGKAQNFFAVL